MKYVKLIFVVILFVSCGTYRQASYISSQCYTGMAIREFKKIAGRKAKLESIDNDRTVFRINDYDALTGMVIDTRFFYFNNIGELYKIDGGQLRETRQSIDLNIRKN